jgi:hypothetical protein
LSYAINNVRDSQKNLLSLMNKAPPYTITRLSNNITFYKAQKTNITKNAWTLKFLSKAYSVKDREGPITTT